MKKRAFDPIRHVINIEPALIALYEKHFYYEFSKFIHVAPFTLNDLGEVFGCSDSNQYRLIGQVNADTFCMRNIETGEYYHIDWHELFRLNELV